MLAHAPAKPRGGFEPWECLFDGLIYAGVFVKVNERPTVRGCFMTCFPTVAVSGFSLFPRRWKTRVPFLPETLNL